MMANPEHLEILKQGAEAWNRWRERHPEERPDLSDADLAGAALQGFNLRNADLRRSNLCDTNLKGVDLVKAALEAAILKGADLSEASLKGAHLSQANLRGANLAGADLSKSEFGRTLLDSACLDESDLTAANLRGANLGGAQLAGADLEHADLTGADVKDADLECIHIGSIQSAARINTEGAKWSRVHLGERLDFDPDHDPEDNSYWLLRNGEETLQQALLRTALEQSTDDITIEFTQAVWRELHLVEIGLREALGDGRFTVQKADDRLAVTFESKGDLQLGLEAVVVQLAALESVEAERVKSMALRRPAGEVVVLEPAELKLEAIAAQMVRMEGMLDRRLPGETDLMDATVENLLDKIPGVNLFTPALVWLYRQGREHFELLRRRQIQKAVVVERRLPSPGEDAEGES